MTADRKDLLRRILTGGVIGMAGTVLVLYCIRFTFYLETPSLAGFLRLLGAMGEENNRGWFAGNLGCAFLLGAETGAATLPFAGRGRTLALQSLAHFLSMAATAWLWGAVSLGPSGGNLFLGLLVVIYICVWAIRWAWWYEELRQMRKKLGLDRKNRERHP